MRRLRKCAYNYVGPGQLLHDVPAIKGRPSLSEVPSFAGSSVPGLFEICHSGDLVSHVWDEWIAPQTILELVRNTAPFLPAFPIESAPLPELGEGPLGFLRILAAAPSVLERGANPEEELLNYFAVCIAAHHATVATFVPTDVDTKIRGLIWRKVRDRDLLRSLIDLTLKMGAWSLDGISTRATTLGDWGPVSGHNGEWLSVITAGLGRALKLGDDEYAEKAATAVDAELRRETDSFAFAFKKNGLELDTLRLAASLTHNLGDVDQAISFWTMETMTNSCRARFHRLAHENNRPYNGTFQTAALLYKEAMSAEGHRHYPLRHVKALRRSADLLLPLGPFLDDWGGVIGSHPSLNSLERAEVLDEMIRGCRKIAGQQGYYRAVAGFQSKARSAFDTAVGLLPNASRKELKDSAFQKQIAVQQGSFESMMKKKVIGLRFKLKI